MAVAATILIWYILVSFLPLFSSVHAEAIRSCDGPINITLAKSIPPPSNYTKNHDDENYKCPSLRRALEFTSLHDETCNITITIPPGLHEIDQSIHISSSVRLIGEDPESSQIKCSQSFTRGLNYTIYFDNSTSIEIAGISITGCPRPISLADVSSVTIKNVTMTKFTNVALEIFNCKQVSINNCTFHNNSGKGTSRIPFRGNTGAVSIGVHNLGEEEITIEINNTIFTNNSAKANGPVHRSTSQAFLKGILTGRAGGLGVFIYGNYLNVSISVTNCLFLYNYARSYGGGLYFVYSSNDTITDKPTIKGEVINSHFIENSADLGGGGFIASIQSRGPHGHPHLLHFEKCLFQSNTGDAGGGFYYYVIYNGGQGNRLTVKDTTFENNTGTYNGNNTDFGSALAASIYQGYQSVTNSNVHVIQNCIFNGNKGNNAIVSLGYIPFRFNGMNTFENNTGDSLRVIGSFVIFEGSMLFTNNICIGLNCGALSLLSFAQIKLVENLTVDFINNSGRFGASIYVGPFDLSTQFKQLPYNPHCFLIPNKTDKRSPEIWTKDINVTMTFVDNTAYFSSVMYVSNLNQCSWTASNKTFNFTQWHIFNYEHRNNSNTAFKDSTNSSYSIVTDAVSIETAETPIENLEIWPGEELKVNVLTKDLLNGATGSIIRLKSNVQNNTSDDNHSVLKITPNTFIEVEYPFQTKFTVFIRNKTNTTDVGLSSYIENDTIFTGNLSLEVVSSTITQLIKPDEIPVTLTQCPGGFSLHNVIDTQELLQCSCDDIHQSEIIQCQKGSDNVTIQAGQWSTRVYNKINHSLSFFPCPQGYCQCFYNTNSAIGSDECVYMYSSSTPDKQCRNGRTGILCGKCDMSITAILNQCSSKCTKMPWPWFIVIGVLDVIIITIITVLDKPLPQWAYPMLFYIQITPLLVLYFPETFWTVGKYLYFPASLIGLYVPYDFCVDKEIDAIEAHALRFIPIITAFIVCPIMVLINIVLVKQRLWQTTLRLHGVWAIFILLYPTAIMNAVRSLHCRNIPLLDSNTTSIKHEYRWFSNGSVKCFSDGDHIAIMLIGCLIILLHLVFMLAVVWLQLSRQECSQRWLVKLLQSVAHPYVNNNHLWGVVDLVFKFVLILLIEIFPRIKVPCIMFLALIVCFSSFCNPYKKKWVNYFQVSIYCIMLVLLMLEASNTLSYKKNTPGTILLLFVYYLPLAMSLFIIIIKLAIAVLSYCTKLRLLLSNLLQECYRTRLRYRRGSYTSIDGYSCQYYDDPRKRSGSAMSTTEVSVNI